MASTTRKLLKLFNSPTFLRHFHGYATLFWFAMLVPTVLWWKESILWVAVMSVWANIGGHWSSWQAARGEEEIFNSDLTDSDSPP